MYSDSSVYSEALFMLRLTRLARVYTSVGSLVLMLFVPLAKVHAQPGGESLNQPESQLENHSQQYSLTVRPESCVALHKGQRCFIRVTLRWMAPKAQEYCLFNDIESKPLICSSAATGRFVTNYASDSSTRFQLRVAGENNARATAVVSTSWVYRTGRKSSSSWRLF